MAGGIFMVNGRIAAGDLVAYMLYVSTLIATIRRIIEFAEQFQRGMTGIERFLQIVDADIEIFDEPDAIELKDPKGEISFEKVSFEYPDDHNKVFTDLNLQIHAGEKVAIVGPSGGGKTTLARLIARFADVTEGNILIGGVNVKNIDEKELMDTVSFVFQDSHLLKMSILDNVRMGNKNATRQEVMEALKNAQCDDIIEKLPDGIDTVIGSKGTYLSGGEAQRIAIARAMLKNSPMLILDEATAFADPDNEAKVQAAFERLSQGKTVIMIAHRLSSVTGVDRVYVLKNGQINQSGKHNELAESGGLYAHMWEEYNKSVNWKVGV